MAMALLLYGLSRSLLNALKYCFISTCNSVMGRSKYVNMADINLKLLPRTDESLVELVELFFFAYRDFTADPDHILAKIGFGRAHHRVLHFVGRNPGMTVAELLDILKITKQSLGRVLRELIEKDYIVQEEGSHDRRQRLLYLTVRGDSLHQELMAPQLTRFDRALARSSGSDKAFTDMLLHMIDGEGREQLRTIQARARKRDRGNR
jgi:DNA-binding MarR family transcriptional regulator